MVLHFTMDVVWFKSVLANSPKSQISNTIKMQKSELAKSRNVCIKCLKVYEEKTY